MVIAQAIVIAKMHRRRGWVFAIVMAQARHGDAHAAQRQCRSRGRAGAVQGPPDYLPAARPTSSKRPKQGSAHLRLVEGLQVDEPLPQGYKKGISTYIYIYIYVHNINRR